jgi:hypothetical protein
MTPASLFGNPGPLRAWVTPLVPLTWLGDAHPAATSNPVRIGGYGAPDWARSWTVRALNVEQLTPPAAQIDCKPCATNSLLRNIC